MPNLFSISGSCSWMHLGAPGSTLIQDTKNKRLFSCTTLGSLSNHENGLKWPKETVLEDSPFAISNLTSHLKH